MNRATHRPLKKPIKGREAPPKGDAAFTRDVPSISAITPEAAAALGADLRALRAQQQKPVGPALQKPAAAPAVPLKEKAGNVIAAKAEAAGRDKSGRFLPGTSGNPAGREKGSRNKLTEDFIQALYDDFREHGREVLEDVRRNRPADYLKALVSLAPKESDVRVEVHEFERMTAIELRQYIIAETRALGIAEDVEADFSGFDEGEDEDATSVNRQHLDLRGRR